MIYWSLGAFARVVNQAVSNFGSIRNAFLRKDKLRPQSIARAARGIYWGSASLLSAGAVASRRSIVFLTAEALRGVSEEVDAPLNFFISS